MIASTIPKMTPIRMVGLVSGMISRLVADAKLRRYPVSRKLFYLVGMMAVIGCASTPSRPDGSTPLRRGNVLSAEEIASAHADINSAYDIHDAIVEVSDVVVGDDVPWTVQPNGCVGREDRRETLPVDTVQHMIVCPCF